MSTTVSVTATWYQTCNLFSSGQGNGACGTCFRDRDGLAYPNLAAHGTNYASACGIDSSLAPQVTCGTVITVANDDCGTNSVNMPVVDHGPNLPVLGCPDDNYHCLNNRSFRLIDLTRQGFLDVGGDLAWGILGVRVTIP